MLTEKQVLQIREHLEAAQNPVFFFDNDQDGLCSFLLLQRFIGRGKGIPIKSFPALTKEYFRRVSELNADYIFVLDKPMISDEFLEEAKRISIPIVWIDHHDMGEVKIFENIFYYNPSKEKEAAYEATSLFSYQISQKKEDMWIAVIGCISDAFVPSFYKDFSKDYPDLVVESFNALDIYYTSEIGKVAQILGAGLKDKTTNVINMLKLLMKARTPYEILEENSKNYFIHKRYNEINRKFQRLLEKGITLAKNSGDVLFFEYSGDLSISSELANALKQKFSKKTIVVGYIRGAKVNISVRGDNAKKIILKIVGEIEGSTGGGHPLAVGAKVNVEDWEKFKTYFRQESSERV